ncbi:MAG: HD domain-containing protein [Fluviicola sp.]|nr:HD domain-containing protein [Fluviicola sp.]MBP6271572.1 HD domain-containing protein [Fluviicola sp.]
MSTNQLISSVRATISSQFQDHAADHDFQHIERVTKIALHIAEKEGGDLEVVELAALLHDISDHKLNGGILNDNGRASKILLEELNAPIELIQKVVEIVDLVSYKGANVPDVSGSIELSIVRDADRLDAIGAIGIARAFHFGGSRNRPFYTPDIPVVLHDSFDQYSNDKSHTINHFHEKLLLINDRLETATAKQIGAKRHALLEQFVAEFYKEWNVEL